jgi:hypothetical protein
MADEHAQTEAIHGHERTDMSITAIVWFFGGLLVSALLIHLLLAWMFSYMQHHYARGEAVSPFSPPRELPPYPRLQVSPQSELREYKAKEEQVLSSYAWEDKSKGIVRIPIDRAIELIAERGMPATPAPAAQSGLPRNPATATAGGVETPRGTAMTPGNPGALPAATSPPSAPPNRQKPLGGAQK